jgi:hypothetical protein
VKIIVGLSKRQVDVCRVVEELSLFDEMKSHIVAIAGERCEKDLNSRPLINLIVKIFAILAGQIIGIYFFNNSIKQANIFTLLLHHHFKDNRGIRGEI